MSGAGLDERWRLLVEAVAPHAGRAAVEVGARLQDRYRQPHRRYHTLEHLTELLESLDALGHPSPAVALAAWFHDCVYDPAARSGVNEDASAQVATSELSGLHVDDSLTVEVARLVRLTAAHAADPGDTDGRLLIDADLAILGAPPERYRRYAAQVRAEYAHVDDGSWRAGRSAFVEGMLARPHIFSTDEARRRLEPAARANLLEELAALGRTQTKA